SCTDCDETCANQAGHYSFDFAATHAELLKRLSIIANDATAPFVAASTSHVVGCESLVASPDPDNWQFVSDGETELAWEELRRLPTARYLDLVLPRFLLRLPYGRYTKPTEEFSFEELPENGDSRQDRKSVVV